MTSATHRHCSVPSRARWDGDMASVRDVLYLLLAGGQSRRMGGGDKNLRDLCGKPLLGHVIARAVPDDAIALINANGDAARYEAFGLPVVGDVVKGFAGPLAGVLTGLEWAVANQPSCSHVISLATDAPFLPKNLGPALVAAIEDGAELAQAQSNNRRHPVFGIWPVSLAPVLRTALVVEGLRKVDHFTARYECRAVPFAGDPDPFMNLNAPGDFGLAQQILDA